MIGKIINEWDPIELFPLAPDDEYIREIEIIEKIVQNNSGISSNDLAYEIYHLFLERFGSEVFLCDIEDCLKIAMKIMGI